MTKLSKDYAPYAFTGNVLDILHRLRDAGLPEIIDTQVVIRIGVSQGNSHRTVAALRFLGLIDEDGQQTEVTENLARASTEDYPSVLAEILRNGYSGIFEVINPSNTTEVQIFDAFRGYKPQSQWKRMAQLFIGLCQEAGLYEGEPATTQKSSPTFKRTKSSIRSSTNSAYWFSEFKHLLDKLPDQNDPSWDTDTKRRWLKALESLLDFLIDLED